MASFHFVESDPVWTDQFMYGGIGVGQASDQAVQRDRPKVYPRHLYFALGSSDFRHWTIGSRWVLITARILQLDTVLDTFMIIRAGKLRILRIYWG
jgi:hypothetical protein